MIIYGWGKKTVKEYGEKLPMQCSCCKNNVFLKLVRVRTWFTVFFIPVIRYKSKNLLICDVCKSEVELTSDKFKRAKVLTHHTMSYKNNTIDSEEYKKYIDEANLFDETLLSEELLKEIVQKKEVAEEEGKTENDLQKRKKITVTPKGVLLGMVFAFLAIALIVLDSSTYIEDGIDYYDEGEYEKTIEKINTGMKLFYNESDKNDVYVVLGDAYSELEYYDEALQSYEKALEIDSKTYKALVGIGIVNRSIGNYDIAEEAYLSAFKIKHDYPELYASMCVLYIVMEDYEKAILYGNQAIDYDYTIAVAHANLSMAYIYNGELELARASLKRAEELGYENYTEIHDMIEASNSIIR